MASSTDQRQAKKKSRNNLQKDMMDTGNLPPHTSAITITFKYLNPNSFPCPRISPKQRKFCLWCYFLQCTVTVWRLSCGGLYHFTAL